MRKTIFLPLALIALGVTGCATKNWQHTSITDPVIVAKQLSADDGYCSLVASGAAPMPQIPVQAGPTVTNVSGQFRTRNTTTGQTTYGTYTGQATNVQSGGFAGGFASGMANGAALGAAIAASRERDRLHAECMSAKGWVDAPSGTPLGTEQRGTQTNQPIAQNKSRSTIASTEATGVLTCRVGSAAGTQEDPGEQFDFQMRVGEAKIWHGVFKKEIAAVATEDEYRWKVNLRDISPKAENLTVVGVINRYSGEFREVIEGDKGVVPWSKGACKRIERAL